MSQKLPALCARTTIFFLILAVGAAIWPSRAAAQPALDTKPGEVKVTDIPDEIIKKFKLDTTFYKKHIDYHGFSILSSAKVSDAGLIEARHLIDQLLGERSDILKAMIKAGCRFMVMSPTEMTTHVPEQRHMKNDPKTNWDTRARGLGGKLSSCGEENLLNLKGDRYKQENILIHEFNHAIHRYGLGNVDRTFDGRLREAYKKAMAKELWKGTYLTTNHSEYWAEGAQAYFDCMRPQFGANTREKLQKYDPDLFALVDEVYKQSKFRYVRYDQRKPPAVKQEQPEAKQEKPKPEEKPKPDVQEKKDKDKQDKPKQEKPKTNLGSDKAGNPLRLALKTGHISNYDESKVKPYTLPDPLVASGNTRVRDARAWRVRRAEILRLYETEIYGRVPANAPSVTWRVAQTDRAALSGSAVVQHVVGAVGHAADGPRINLDVYTPAHATGPVPVILMVNFGGGDSARGRSLAAAAPTAASEILARGWGYASVGYQDIQPDR